MANFVADRKFDTDNENFQADTLQYTLPEVTLAYTYAVKHVAQNICKHTHTQYI